MKRHFVPAVGVMLMMSACLLVPARPAAAQTTVPSVPGGSLWDDPFSFYYAIYLPNQQLQAMRPTPLDSINDAMVQRQYFAQSNRRDLHDPISPYAESYDPLQPFTNQRERVARPYRFSRRTTTSHGAPSLYFERLGNYYPDMAGRTGRNKNANVYSGRGAGVARSGRAGGMGGGAIGGGGFGGMGGMGGMGGFGGMGGMGMF
jgi:hypothetical protein